MAHLSLSQSFLVIMSKLAVSLQPASPLSPPFSPPHQHLASLQPTIILALRTEHQYASLAQADVFVLPLNSSLVYKEAPIVSLPLPGYIRPLPFMPLLV